MNILHHFTGTAHIDRTETSPRPVHLHLARIDLTAPGLRFTVSPPAGTREVTRQTTRDFLESQRAQLAINAHFFLPFPSADTDAWVLGLAASDGHVYSAFESPEQSFALVTDAPALNIDRKNRARIVHRDARRADGRHVRERVTLWNTVAGSAQIVTEGRVTIPVYRDAAHPAGVLTPGSPSSYSNEKSWNEAATARTAIGLSRDRRTLTLVTVWGALNLDGGGSTTMAWLDPDTGKSSVLNTSSDNPGGRAVASSLAVFARPVPRH